MLVYSWRERPDIRRFLVVPILLAGCAGTLVVYPPTSEHAGALRVAEVMELVPGNDLHESYYPVLYRVPLC